VTAFIYSSFEAATFGLLDVPDIDPRISDYEYKLHAIYVFDQKNHEDYLEISPGGHKRNDPLHATRIDLPAVGTPTCKIGINGRCLLEFEHMDYPYIEHEPEGSGQVNIAGNIQPDGVVSGVAVVGAKVTPPARRDLFATFAAKNLKTWRFEPGKNTDAVRITYRFELVDRTPTYTGFPPRVRFELPGQVTIQTTR
jgi:hypothetical protein